MQSALDKVDFDKYTLYTIQINVEGTFNFGDLKEGEKTEDEDGQSLDVVSDVRRSIKYSFPFEDKKVISSIKVEDEAEDENGDLCRDLQLEYYLLVETEDLDSFSMEELHDELDEEWTNNGASCKININPYEV